MVHTHTHTHMYNINARHRLSERDVTLVSISKKKKMFDIMAYYYFFKDPSYPSRISSIKRHRHSTHVPRTLHGVRNVFKYPLPSSSNHLCRRFSDRWRVWRRYGEGFTHSSLCNKLLKRRKTIFINPSPLRK